jgi:hypothetical protein
VVTAPAATAPGHDSPDAAAQGEHDATTPAQHCAYYPPSALASCQAILAEAPASSSWTVRNFALGYLAVDGNKALAGTTGTWCPPDASCWSNDDPAAIFSQAKPFPVLWAESVAAKMSASTSYSLTPLVKVGGNWYLYWPLAGGNNSTAT